MDLKYFINKCREEKTLFEVVDYIKNKIARTLN